MVEEFSALSAHIAHFLQCLEDIGPEKSGFPFQGKTGGDFPHPSEGFHQEGGSFKGGVGPVEGGAAGGNWNAQGFPSLVAQVEVEKKRYPGVLQVGHAHRDGAQPADLVLGRDRAPIPRRRRVTRAAVGDEREALAEAADALEAGADEATSFDRGLAQLLRRGVAFHHAGLTNRHRKLVEAQFRERRLKALVATPTLAAGVNLPARRVIVRDLKRWEASFQSNQPLPVLEVLQMLGRAGRPGYDAEGEGVLMTKDVAQAEEAEAAYFRGEPEPVVSRLGAEPALRTHLLALIAAGATSDREALHSFLDRTLFGAQGELWRTQHRLNRVLEFLREEGLITMTGAEPGEFAPASETQREGFAATDFGRRVAQLYVDPLTGVTMRRALESGVPPNPLGLLHMVARTPDIHSLYVRKQEMETYLVRMMNAEGELMLPTPEDQVEMEFYLWDLKTALLLQDWSEEMPEEQLLKRYSTTPGDIRAKVDVAEWLLYAATELARLLAPEAVAELEQLRTRVTHGVRRELLPLLALPGVGRIRARALFNHGFAAPDAFTSATEAELARVPGIGSRLAEQLAGQREPEQTTL